MCYFLLLQEMDPSMRDETIKLPITCLKPLALVLPFQFNSNTNPFGPGSTNQTTVYHACPTGLGPLNLCCWEASSWGVSL